MREIKFRGRKINTGELVYGCYLDFGGKTYMFDWDMCDNGVSDIVHAIPIQYEVNPETIGQYTGLTDKNGTEIYEGDVLSTDNGTLPNTGRGIVKEYKGMYVSFYGQDILERDCYDELNRVCNAREVIGNVWENPELLK